MIIVYRLRKKRIEELVASNVPGTYLLGEAEGKDFRVRYIGRSDSCLRSRLLCHAKKSPYHFFSFKTCASKKQAFSHECFAFHTYLGLDNEIHPATNGAISCPVCSVLDQFASAHKRRM